MPSQIYKTYMKLQKAKAITGESHDASYLQIVTEILN